MGSESSSQISSEIDCSSHKRRLTNVGSCRCTRSNCGDSDYVLQVTRMKRTLAPGVPSWTFINHMFVEIRFKCNNCSGEYYMTYDFGKDGSEFFVGRYADRTVKEYFTYNGKFYGSSVKRIYGGMP